ncbi:MULTISPECIES: class I SAM-dependent methyltransferase [Thiorhodovibrio]|uniref:class I SAM-dependent methyltransferase n=1 Tax=Thiorhodovibrio TaxID=61593 RepID=UPI00191202EF|nr:MULTISPECIES: FkbM family methyltransferase [Thiorhodovibrio]MBK5969019.1 hypothetical protein [Thiorhodovibrio winogradskyi]WPL15100.1 bifunctional 3-demethylubiquinone-9 3-methyltransferase/ 2-octaprenyl-6-hydroxy phenol methylase [Thiorhodovibrio litoralis]
MNKRPSQMTPRSDDLAAWCDGEFDPHASPTDIFNCFRLLLGRLPSRSEWSGHSARVGEDLASVVSGYVNSREFSGRGLIGRQFLDDLQWCQLDGFGLLVSSTDLAVGKAIATGTTYEPHVARVFHERLSPGSGVLDIGANVGYFSMLAASLVGPNGFVLAVEPSAANVKLLETSRRRNRFYHLRVLMAAAGDQLGLLGYNSSHSNGIAGSLADGVEVALAAELVPVVPVDSQLVAEQRIDLIKIDVEGGEYLALKGLTHTLARWQPAVVFEFSPEALTNISAAPWQSIFQLLALHGYRFQALGAWKDGRWTIDAQDLFDCYQASGVDHIDVLAEPDPNALSKPSVHASASLRDTYTNAYYLEDCGGFATYTASGGKALDPRLDTMARLATAHREQPFDESTRVLDLGCGRGELTRYFAALGCRVDAIDYAEAAVRLAEDCFAGEPEARARVRLQCGSVTDVALWQGPYDLILASDLIEHLAPEENVRLYALAAAHLSPSGCLIVHSFPNLWYYRYGYPRRRREAAARGEMLPAEPRTHYELTMHINEQSPRVMRRQLCDAFAQVLLWAGDHQTPAGSLAKRFTKSDWRDAPSLFAIAAQGQLTRERVITALERPAPAPDAFSPTSPSAAQTPATMLIPNNPEIDFPALNARVQARLESMRDTPPPDLTPQQPPPDSMRRFNLVQLKAWVASIPVLGSVAVRVYAWLQPYRLLNRINQLEARTEGRLAAAEALLQQASAHLNQHDDLHRQAQERWQLGEERWQLGEERWQLGEERWQLGEERWQDIQLKIRAAADIRQELPSLKRRIAELNSVQALLARTIEGASAVPVASQAPASVQTAPPAPEDQAFYVAFEDNFRGDPASIEERLGYYRPLLKKHLKNQRLLHAPPQLRSADLGCGRGEWLNVLRSESIEATGIDLNPHNIHHCQALGHSAEQADALTWLAQQQPASFALITSFHLIEHLPVETLLALLGGCARALAPGGLLILETPNPENLLTSGTSFYMDPTHRHPLPPALLQFMLDYHGFTDIQVHRLNPVDASQHLPETSETAKRCNYLFYGPQDYAVSAQIPASN